MRVVVCGGRHFHNQDRLYAALDDWMPASVAQGGATGADFLAREWCRLRRVPCVTYSANWKEDGPAAGPLRNALMLRDFKPDRVLAFPGGRGTADTVRKARKAGICVSEYAP